MFHALLRFDSYQLISTDGEIIAGGPRPYMMKKRAIDWAGRIPRLATQTACDALLVLLEIPA